MYHIFSKYLMIWQEKGFSSDFIPWAVSTVCFHGKLSLNFKIKLPVSFPKKYIKSQNKNIIFYKSKFCCPKWKYTLKLQEININMISY